MITADVLQRITLVTPDNSKQIMSEIKGKLKGEPLPYVDLKKLWKALFYAMWHSDKYQNQQNLAQEISQLLRVYYQQKKTSDNLFLYLKAMMFVFSAEWEKIDYWRMNKFLMMYRCIQEEIMKLQKHFNWRPSLVDAINTIYRDNITNQGLFLHFTQVFVDSLQKHLSNAEHQHIEQLLSPFLNIICEGEIKVLRDKAKEYVFDALKTVKLGGFNLDAYIKKLRQIAQSNEPMKPQNRKILYEIIQDLEYNEVEAQEQQDYQQEEERQEQEQDKPVHDQLENGSTQKKKRKREKQQQQQLQEEQDQDQQVQLEEKQIEEHEQEELEELKEHRLDEVELKKRKKIEKAQQKLQQQQIQQQVEEDSDLEGLDYSVVRASQEKMQQLRDIMNTVPPYLFLSPAEKRKYFGNVSKRFSEAMAKEAGSQCSHERIVKFDLNRNQVKLFRKQESAAAVSQKKPKQH